MCRSIAEGGRRCSKSHETKKRERDASRRYYARKKAAANADRKLRDRGERLQQHGFDDAEVARTRAGSAKSSELVDQFRPWTQSLSERELDAVQRYTGSESRINDSLREGAVIDSLSSKSAAFVKNLDAALAKVQPSAEPQTVYRGIMFIGNGPEAVRAWAEATFEPGATVDFPAYLSTSSDPTVAMGFAHQDESVVFEMRARSGAHVAEVSTFPPECEHLIGRGSQWSVVDISHDVRIETESGDLAARTMVHLVET